MVQRLSQAFEALFLETRQKRRRVRMTVSHRMVPRGAAAFVNGIENGAAPNQRGDKGRITVCRLLNGDPTAGPGS